MILLVASEDAERAAMAQLIAAAGYPVDPLDCGDEVVKRLRFRKTPLVIIDCDFADGFHLLKRIRSEPTSRTTPVVMFSTSAPNLRERALGEGADAYVPKGSLDWADLIKEVTRFAGSPQRR